MQIVCCPLRASFQEHLGGIQPVHFNIPSTEDDCKYYKLHEVSESTVGLPRGVECGFFSQKAAGSPVHSLPQRSYAVNSPILPQYNFSKRDASTKLRLLRVVHGSSMCACPVRALFPKKTGTLLYRNRLNRLRVRSVYSDQISFSTQCPQRGLFFLGRICKLLLPWLRGESV